MEREGGGKNTHTKIEEGHLGDTVSHPEIDFSYVKIRFLSETLCRPNEKVPEKTDSRSIPQNNAKEKRVSK